MHEAARAQGGAALAQVHDVNVRYEGRWLSRAVRSFQPVLVDERFRGTSEERLLLDPPVTAQSHIGSGGVKHVVRDGSSVRVWYNGVESHDAEALAAAALVADAYRMFLLGPRFFAERGATVHYYGHEEVCGAACDQVLAVLRPGIGNDAEDRVMLSIDRKTHLVRRFRMTVDGLSSTRGAVADIYVGDYVRIAGVVWPTSFYEELKRPFGAAVHRWRLVGIDMNRGLTRDALSGPDFTGPATRPAGMSAP